MFTISILHPAPQDTTLILLVPEIVNRTMHPRARRASSYPRTSRSLTFDRMRMQLDLGMRRRLEETEPRPAFNKKEFQMSALRSGIWTRLITVRCFVGFFARRQGSVLAVMGCSLFGRTEHNRASPCRSDAPSGTEFERGQGLISSGSGHFGETLGVAKTRLCECYSGQKKSRKTESRASGGLQSATRSYRQPAALKFTQFAARYEPRGAWDSGCLDTTLLHWEIDLLGRGGCFAAGVLALCGVGPGEAG
ncbi:hypothetical protein B0H17DRAFT_1274084 [Mycena rosella]|uniref:Uncharacterized protein n=1 Tax=Mycena rosella TaxID=1033263 RepID=A0AAD7MAR2_MYCRO|nr:hypothetical protein B0H17DRAFT_1274084 [Mycena rosella]